MASCEKCWRRAQMDPYGGIERYHELIETEKCTPEEQAGEDATVCSKCERKTVHQYAHVCMVCGYDAKPATSPPLPLTSDHRK